MKRIQIFRITLQNIYRRNHERTKVSPFLSWLRRNNETTEAVNHFICKSSFKNNDLPVDFNHPHRRDLKYNKLRIMNH